MCGFVGYIDGGETQLMEPVLHAMADRIRHRGPDDADYYMDGSISLGFPPAFHYRPGRRQAANTRMRTRAKCCMFNGEIYNYPGNHKGTCLQAGHVFKTANRFRGTSSRLMRNTVQIYSISCAGCSRSSFGTGIPDDAVRRPGLILESSPSTTQRCGSTLMFGCRDQEALCDHPAF